MLGLNFLSCNMGREETRLVRDLPSNSHPLGTTWKWVFAGVVKLGGGRGGRVDPDPDACPSEKRGSGTRLTPARRGVRCLVGGLAHGTLSHPLGAKHKLDPLR